MAIRVGGCIVICDNKSLANVCSIGLQSGNEGVCGQFLQSRGPGQPSTWNSIANLDFSAVQTIASYSYDDRGTLRTLTSASNGAQAFVEDIGYFKFSSGVLNEVDDGETAFIVSGVGTWLLTAPTWNAIEALNTLEDEMKAYSVTVCATVGGGSGCGTCCFCGQTSVCQFANVPGVQTGDILHVRPKQGCILWGSVDAYYSCNINCTVIRVTPIMCGAFDCMDGCGGPSTCLRYFMPYYSSTCVCDWQVTVNKVNQVF